MALPPPRMLRTVLAGVLVVATAAGCAWRVETPPLERRTPEPAVVLRDQAAVREQAVIDAADLSAAGRLEAVLAPERLAALGGVYVATPAPSPSPSPTAGDAAPALAAAVTEAVTGALAGAEAADRDDPSLAAMLRSLALSHAVVSAAPDVAGAAPAERAMPGIGDEATGPWLPTTATAIEPADLAALAVAYDRAAFAYEVSAARAGTAERRRDLERSRVLAARAEQLIALPGVADRRASLYDVPPAGTQTPAARAATQIAVETELAERHAALLNGIAAADVAWALNAAYDAWLQAASMPGFEAGSIPALPGIEPVLNS